MTTTSNTAAIAAAVGTFNLCACGCARVIGRKSSYAQGHDAKHVSESANAWRTSDDREAVHALAAKHL